MDSHKRVLLNQCSISSTYPDLPEKLISRDSFLDMIEGQLETNKVLVIDGDKGVGLTTTLAMFAGKHNKNSISYFCSDFSTIALNVAKFKASVNDQLDFYISGANHLTTSEVRTPNPLFRIVRKLKQNKQVLYFVFDGFDRVADGNRDLLRNFITNLYNIQNTRFLFSGNFEKIKQILPQLELTISSQILVRFEKNAVLDYIKEIYPSTTNEHAEMFWHLSKGNAERLSCLLDIYKKNNCNIEVIDKFDRYCEDDFYIEDYNYISAYPSIKGKLFMALLTLSEMLIHEGVIIKVLDINKEYKEITNYFAKYIKIVNGYPQIDNCCLRKYLYRKMDSQLRLEVENLLIMILESENLEDGFYTLPSLYHRTDHQYELVKYLTSNKVQDFLEKRKSQSAINEQCDYGLTASSMTNNENASFRFAVTRSASREMEQNELSEIELLALLAVGDYETAYELSQSVFLLEERLKCLLLMAQRKETLPVDMAEDIFAQIDDLVSLIDFAHIPDKAIELAKLMIPIKFSQALSIIDQISKVTNDRHRIDRLYTMFSLAYDEGDGNKEDLAKADIAATRITNEDLRTLSHAMRGMFRELTVDQLLVEIEKLPNDSNKLYFLQFWIPEHKNIANIGDAILYAVKLIIQASDITTPKVSLLKEYCKPLSLVPVQIINEILIKLEVVTEYIKYPTIDYVELQLLIIEALMKHEKEKAYSKLQDLYLEISEYKDKNIMIHAKSILLGNYEKLGTPKEMENVLMPGFELQNEIERDVLNQFKYSAYHMKVVEGVIRELVCFYPSLIDAIVPHMNTEPRRTRAYLLAASVYAERVNLEKLDVTRFLKYIDLIKYDTSDIGIPIKIIIRRLTAMQNYEEKLLSIIKCLSSAFDKIEDESTKCQVLSNVYIWGAKSKSDDNFFKYIKSQLDKTWEGIDSPWLKVIIGYEIAKSLSRISLKLESREYIEKTKQYRNEQILPNYSCVRAVHASLSMYVHSLGVLIRSQLNTENDLERLKTLLAHYDSDGETIILWGYLALEYYVAGNKEQFSNIVRLYIDKDLSNFSFYNQKKILFNISPVLYLNAPEQYIRKISSFDERFINTCIEHVASFIISKYPYISDIETKNDNYICRDLDYSDISRLIHLLKISTDECFVFSYVELLTRKEKDNELRKLSREQRNDMLSSLDEIINNKFPTKSGIQHKGYQVICKAMLLGCKQYAAVDWEKIKSEIEGIDNLADKAFLYLHSANFIRNVEKRNTFLDKGLEYSLSISGGFDKMNRMDMCLSSTFLSRDKIRTRSVANSIMKAMLQNENGTFQDYQKFIDIVYENDPQLADQLVDQVDRDQVRLHFKNRLKKHILSNKKINTAKDSLQEIPNLDREEQICFYKKQLTDLVANKATIRNIDELYPIIDSIYHGPIMSFVDAIIYYIENVYRKNLTHKNANDILRQIHESLYCNLRLVFAVSSSTQERMQRINEIMSRTTSAGANGMVLVGEDSKGHKIIMEWYQKYQFDVLRVIDPYFHPEDLIFIKKLFDLNANLDVTILTNMEKQDASIEDYQMVWNQISSDMPGRLKIVLLYYTDKKTSCPIHDRWWILFDPEDGTKAIINTPSLSTLGVRDTVISEMDSSKIPAIEELWGKYVNDRIRKMPDGRRISYEEVNIR